MQMITVEIKNKKALNLLKDLEELDMIKLHKSESEKTEKEKSSKYRGFMSTEAADALLKHTEESRKEWEERFPTK